MTLTEIRVEIARNLNLLVDDETTIRENIVTSTGIDKQVNIIYREELFPPLSEKFPDDFAQETVPFNTYTATGTVDATSTGTTLVSTTPIFDSTMLGRTVENSTDDETAKITVVTSTTQVTVDTTIGDTWDGDTIYVLGNEYAFGGDTVDLKSVKAVNIKYHSTDTTGIEAKRRDFNDLYQYGNEVFSLSSPYWYKTMIDVGGTPKNAIGILPYPESYLGTMSIRYTERPPTLTASDEPTLAVAGISLLIIWGVTAWGFRLQKKYEDADRYMMLYENAKKNIVKNYRPLSASGPNRVRPGNTSVAINTRST